jgi:hypothetical protein
MQLTEPLGPLQHLQHPPPRFPKVREVTFDSYRNPDDLLDSMVPFPNLSNLGAQHVFSQSVRQWAEAGGPIPVINLRKLSIFCNMYSQFTVLQFCPLLEDLECHTRCPGGARKIVWLPHTKRNLRRLAWSNHAAVSVLRDMESSGDSVPGIPDWVSLRDFDRLEILEIDQATLLVNLKMQRASALSSALPRTLRILHIAFAREVLTKLEIADQLRELACYKATDVPKLSIVRVDEPRERASGEEALAGYLLRTGVVAVMSDAGITLKIGQDPSASDSHRRQRSLLSRPMGAGSSAANRYFTFQDEVIILEDNY